MNDTYEDILYREAAGVATLTINRPDVLNAMRLITIAELTDAFRRADANRSIGVIVLRGAGEWAFCVGGDQKTMVSTLDGDGWRVLARALRELFATMRGTTKPVIAAVRGWCIGGGHELHCFADLTIADEGARFGQVGARVGGAPIFVTRLLPRIVGEKRAREILMLCEQYSAAQALEMGLINKVVPGAEFDEAVDRLCADLLAKSPAILRTLKLAVSADDVLGDDVIPMVVESLVPFFGSAEQREATTAFSERRAPDFGPFRSTS